MSSTHLSLEDRLDIQDLFSNYGYAIDDNRADDWLALFTDDGAFVAEGLGRSVGPAALRQVVEMVAAGSQGKWRHQLTNILAQAGDAPLTARVRMNGLVSDWSIDPPNLSFMDYTAQLKKINGQWRIAEIAVVPNKITV